MNVFSRKPEMRHGVKSLRSAVARLTEQLLESSLSKIMARPEVDKSQDLGSPIYASTWVSIRT
jgi:hypothetical protein